MVNRKRKRKRKRKKKEERKGSVNQAFFPNPVSCV